MERNFDIHEWQAKHLRKLVKEDYKIGGDSGLDIPGDGPTPVKVDRVMQEVRNVASIMEDAFQGFARDAQQKYPGIFQDKQLLDRISMMAEQIKQLKRLSGGA